MNIFKIALYSKDPKKNLKGTIVSTVVCSLITVLGFLVLRNTITKFVLIAMMIICLFYEAVCAVQVLKIQNQKQLDQAYQKGKLLNRLFTIIYFFVFILLLLTGTWKFSV